MRSAVTLQDVRGARNAIAHLALMTPILQTRSLGQMVGCELLLKAENLQRAGSFKVRGAANKIAVLSPDQKALGVIAASAGNHAQGVALAAANLGIPCTIVMPWGAAMEYAFRAGYDGRGRVSVTHVVEMGCSGMLTQLKFG